MPRVSKKQNEADKKNVLDALLRDPNADVDSLASKCNLSTQQVYRILRILEEEKIIFGNPMLIDLQKLNKKRFIILAKRGNQAPGETSIRSALYSEEFLNSMHSKSIDIIPEDDYTCSGEYDVVTIIIAESSYQAVKYMDFLRNVAGGYFLNFSMLEVMFTTRKNMKMTPDVELFTEYVSEVSKYTSRFKD